MRHPIAAELTVNVQLDLAPIWSKLPFLKSGDFDQVAALALNDTAKNGEVDAVKVLRPLLGLPSAEIKQAFRIDPANAGHLEAQLVCADRPVKLIRFGARQDEEGVTAKIGGKQETYKHAFIVTVPKTGHRGVFHRKPGTKRLPIFEVYGPSIHGMLARRDVLPSLTDELRDRLAANLLRQADRRARRNRGYGHGPPR